MVTARKSGTPRTAPAKGGPREVPGATGRDGHKARRDEAVFVDLDRTLLRGASGLVLGAAMRAEGLLDGRPSIPGESLFYRFYDLHGESLAFMAMVRAAPRFTNGWDVGTVRRAGARAAADLAELVQPYAPSVLAGHRASGRLLVLSTTSPIDLVAPFAELLGFDDVVGTRYARRDGRYTGGIDGDFVWATGKLSAVRRWASTAGVDLARSHAYSDSVFDVPLLRAVGHPHAVNPDRRLRAVATAAHWPIEHWDRPPGVPKMAGLEPYHLLRPFVRPEAFPYARFDIAGIENIPVRGPALLASNHRSYFDVVALAIIAARLGRPVRFLAKRELFDAPVVGPLARALGGISVDRGSGSGQPLRDAQRALEAGELVVILPQGTIPRGEAFFDPVLRAKTGTARLAAMTGVPVVPIGVWGTERVWPRSARFPTMTTITNPPAIRIRVGPAVKLGLEDAVADSAAIMAAITALLPEEASAVARPTDEEIARTFPPGHRPT
ncbi:MAG TPA: HAD-IB family hydrolase [Acidimicrobiales bacterium]|nr:HAD-IB family hydrolase [Acidimicrobiales bacterium]